MAYTEDARIVSQVAGSTFAATDLYKAVVIDSSGHVIIPDTTGNILPFGTLYGRTSTTDAAGNQAVPVAIGGIAKLQMAASTLSAGDFVAASTDGYGAAPSTDSYAMGQIVSGSSGGAGRVVSVKLFAGPLDTP